MWSPRVVAFVLALGALSVGAVCGAAGQAEKPVQIVKEVTATRQMMAITYPEDVTISMKFRGTERLPKSSGEAKVERKEGNTEIEVELDEMKPAWFFGGDYNTYVLWTVSPEGHVDNAGEFILEGNRSKLNVTTPLDTFGMFVSAEPHFLVDTPSRFIVLVNTRPTTSIAGLKVGEVKYRGFEGVYNAERDNLITLPEIKKERRSDYGQAQTAVELAERAGAEKYAADELARAIEKLKEAGRALEAGANKIVVGEISKEAVRLAVDAQKRAEERSFQAALDAERKAKADEIGRLEKSVQEASDEAERARLLAQQRQLELEMQQRARAQAQNEAEEAARRAAEEERKRREAEERLAQTQQEAEQLKAAKSQAEIEADRARLEREEARRRLQAALGQVAETRETARGLVVNLPDILFDFNKATLRPGARETMSKLAGILAIARHIRLSVEGHTDSVGSDAYNQKLSERRAQSVYEYLTGGGVPPEAVLEVKGFGETQPVAPNDSSANRQKNRRVEIVITETEVTAERQ